MSPPQAPSGGTVHKPEKGPPLLEARGIVKSFPGVLALDGVDLDLQGGEVHALVGENGAGKSTLIKILAGVHRPDRGAILLDGHELRLRSPSDALNAGIAVIHQEFSLAPGLTARENIFLGREDSRAGFVRTDRERAAAVEWFRRLGLDLDPDIPCRELSVAQQQAVEICRALSRRARILVMDEPTAALPQAEAEKLLETVRELRRQGLGIVHVSHRLGEVLSVADRITVFRDGRRVAARPARDVTRAELIELMVGRKLDKEFPPREGRVGEERLRVCGLRKGEKVRDVSLSVRRGEVVGLTGLVGAGRTELARLVFGADRMEAGTIVLDGKTLRIRNPRDAIAAGIALLTEDRKGQGLVLGQSVRSNFGLPNMGRFSRWTWVNQRCERLALDGHVRSLRVRLADSEQPAASLSGGNQQKVVLAKWIERHCEVILFDEPTRGIDVGAKYEVYQLIRALSAQGKAILMISSELPEVLGMSDRILVMREGRVVGEVVDPSAATQEQILELAVGGTTHARGVADSNTSGAS